MITSTKPSPILTPSTKRVSKAELLPGFLLHPNFKLKSAKQEFDPDVLIVDPINYDDKYMPDDVTRDHTKRMHYAAYRMRKSSSTQEQNRWTSAYHKLRDRVILGNRKLIYRAVRRRMAMANQTEDMIGDCHIVLLQAVAAFNPWMGIRFSTYAYTCLVRALSRLSQKQSSDWLTRSVSFEALPDGEPRGKIAQTDNGALQIPIEDYLRVDHPLLSEREKLILAHRFTLHENPANTTLERVGAALGLSKERVRQVQASAIDKLRVALSNEPNS